MLSRTSWRAIVKQKERQTAVVTSLPPQRNISRKFLLLLSFHIDLLLIHQSFFLRFVVVAVAVAVVVVVVNDSFAVMYRTLNQSSLEESRLQRSGRTVCEFEDYFSISEILMLSERTPVVVSKEVLRLGFLDTTNDEDSLKANTKLELPLWLAKHLYNMYCVEIQLPKAFSRFYVDIMRADSSCVDLKRLQPNYYQVGRQLMALLPAEAQQISKLLVTTYKGRFRKLTDGAQNARIEDTDKVTATFDNEEHAMFLEGQKVLSDLKRWHDRSRRNKISTADLVLNHRKRKREALRDSDPTNS